MPAYKLSITLPEPTYNEVGARNDGNLSQAISQSLERYFYIVGLELRIWRLKLSTEEACVILDALNGTLFSHPYSVGLLVQEMEDAVFDSLDEKWGVNGEELLDKLRVATYPQLAALVDAAERWWKKVGDGGNPSYEDFFSM